MARHIPNDPVLRVQHQLTERDWRLLGWLNAHRVLTTFQIANALFPTLNYAQRRLTTLTGLGLLERFRPFRLQGGSHPYHYALAHTGALLIASARGERPPRKADTTAHLHRITGWASTSSSPIWPGTSEPIRPHACITGGRTPAWRDSCRRAR